MTRLLVADDSETILLLLERRLQMEGYEVATATNGQAVIDAIDAASPDTAPDVILLDAMMPQKSGLEVLRELRTNGNSTPVLIVSAYTEAEDVRDAVKVGADGCMTKPIDWDELLGRIKELSS